MKKNLLFAIIICLAAYNLNAQPEIQLLNSDFTTATDCADIFFNCNLCSTQFGFCPNPTSLYFIIGFFDNTTCNGNTITEANINTTTGILYDIDSYPDEFLQGDLLQVNNVLLIEVDEAAQAIGSITIEASVDDGMGNFCTDEISFTFADCASFQDPITPDCFAGSLDQSLNNQIITCSDPIQVATNGDEDLTLATCADGYVYAYSVWADPYGTGEPGSQISDWIISDPNTSLNSLEFMEVDFGYYYYNQYGYLISGAYYIQGAALCIDGSGAITEGCLADGFLQIEWIYDSSDPDCGAILGCTDPCFAEYDADATADNGTCLTDITGCTDVNAVNYDATIPISCSDESLCTYADNDSDGVADNLEDLDGNGDYTDDDTDMDGIPNYLDDDDDGDGIATYNEDVTADSDMDGIPNYLDNDDDGDSVPTLDEDLNGDGDPTNDDTDMDGIPNFLDADDDGDGQSPLFEDLNGDGDLTNDDTDMDGIPNYLDDDDDGDGVDSSFEDLNGDGDLTNDDTDGDGIPNYIDDDDDGDGDLTIDEDTNGDGDPTNDDIDGDGIPGYLDFDERLVSTYDFNELSFQIYPNPSKGTFIINDFDAQSNALNKNQIKIFNSYGQSISYNINQNQININNNFAGIYFIDINGKRQKFIIQ